MRHARFGASRNLDVLIACAFNDEAHASEFHKLARIPVLKARMIATRQIGEEGRHVTTAAGAGRSSRPVDADA